MDRVLNLLMIKQEEKAPVAYFVLIYLLIGSGMALGRGTASNQRPFL
jgi:hypothetical protein